MPNSPKLYGSLVKRVLKPLAKRVVYRSVAPDGNTRLLYSGLFQLDYFGREVFEWGRRSLFATPVFLSRCAEHGSNITVEQVPYITGPCRIELGSDIRFGGKVDILSASSGSPVLKIHDGVFIGHHTGFAIAKRVEIGRFSSIGNACQIADTEGHSHYNPNRPIWEVPASDEDVAEIVIEDNVQIGHGCHILKGVRIGARSVIGACSVVRNSVPADAVVMGNPARVVKRLAPRDGANGG